MFGGTGTGTNGGIDRRGVKQEKADFQIDFQLPRYSAKITLDKSDAFRIRPLSKPGKG